MDLKIAGKRIFISGSTQGIGYSVAEACLTEGASVVINGRSQHGVEEAVERLQNTAPKAAVSGIAADFADPAQVQELLQQLGEVGILVNNVGIFDIAPFAETTDDIWQQYFEINLMSGVRLSRHLLGSMIAKNWGRIIFIGTESAVDVPANMIHYGASKAAMLALSNGLAKLTKGTGVTVNTVLGGPTYSTGVARTVEVIAAQQGIPAESLKSHLVRETSLIQRFISPEEIANLVTYLASPLSSATNGAALRADGGVLPTTL